MKTKIFSINKCPKMKNEKGFILITVIMFLAVFMVLGFMLLYKITSTVKISGLSKIEMYRFHGAEGGALSVVSYMAKYRETNPPADVLKTGEYEVDVVPLGDTIRYPVGFTSLWKGADMKINSVSPPKPADTSEVEMVVFIPITPVGYGNE
jgi:hypothetical protein